MEGKAVRRGKSSLEVRVAIGVLVAAEGVVVGLGVRSLWLEVVQLITKNREASEATTQFLANLCRFDQAHVHRNKVDSILI